MSLRSKFCTVASAAMFAAGLLTPASARPAVAQVWEETQAVAGSAAAKADLADQRVVLVSDRGDDWTAWGGAMRGIDI